MDVPLDKMLARLSPQRQVRIAARTQELIAEVRTLAELRKAQKLTQQRMAEILGIKEESVSSIENRADLLISTLRKYVQAVGGKLTLQVTFPDRPTVVLSSLSSKIISAPRGDSATKTPGAGRRAAG